MNFGRPLLNRIVVLLCLAVVMCAWWRPLSAPASDRVEDGLKNALTTYTTARLLHGVISVLQGTQVNAEPAGVGATFTPGQALAPAAEMLKQFSDVMLVVCVAFAIEKVLIAIGTHWVLAGGLTVVALGWLSVAAGARRPPLWLSKLFLLLLMVQFAVPLTLLASDEIFQRFMAEDYRQSQRHIEGSADSAGNTREPIAIETKDRGPFERLKDWFDKRTAGAVADYQSLKEIAANAAKHIVKLIAVFVLQTVILPLLLLWGLYAMTRALLGWTADTSGSFDRSYEQHE